MNRIKIILPTFLEEAVNKYAIKNNLSFSGALRELLKIALKIKEK